MSLQDEFNNLVGLIIKDPHRGTRDLDPEADKITDLAQKHGLHVNWVKANDNDDLFDGDPFMGDVVGIDVTITKDDVPADKQSWGWRVQKITID